MTAFQFALAWIIVASIVLGGAVAAVWLDRRPGLITLIALTLFSGVVASVVVPWA